MNDDSNDRMSLKKLKYFERRKKKWIEDLIGSLRTRHTYIDEFMLTHDA